MRTSTSWSGSGFTNTRNGAKNAKNFGVCFVLSPNTSAYFAPWREILCFSLAKAPRTPRASMFVLFLPQTPLRTLRLGEKICFFSLAEAQGSQRTSMYILFLPHTPLRTLRLGEKFYVFLSRRRRGRQELRCLFCSCPKYLCVLCALARKFVFSLAKAPGMPGNA